MLQKYYSPEAIMQKVFNIVEGISFNISKGNYTTLEMQMALMEIMDCCSCVLGSKSPENLKKILDNTTNRELYSFLEELYSQETEPLVLPKVLIDHIVRVGIDASDYHIGHVTADGKMLGEFTYQQVGLGGELLMTCMEDMKDYRLDRDSLTGAFKACIDEGVIRVSPVIANITPASITLKTADSIVQYAIYGEQRFSFPE